MLNETSLTKRNSVELWLRTKDEKYFNQVYAQFQKGLFRHVQKIEIKIFTATRLD